MKRILIIITTLAMVIAACKSKDGDYTLFSTSDDLALGEKISSQIENDPVNFPILEKNEYPELYLHLDSMLKAILSSDDILHREELAWELKVIDNDTVYNAFCTPGGFIYVYTGLIRFVESEDELAGIIAHEVAHGDLRHSTDQLTKAYGLKLIMSLLLDGDAELLANIGANLLSLKFSRSDESEADTYAVRYLGDTSYNPVAFAEFFERLQKQGEGAGALQFLSTHPDPGNRIEKIRAGTAKETATNIKSGNFERIVRSLP